MLAAAVVAVFQQPLAEADLVVLEVEEMALIVLLVLMESQILAVVVEEEDLLRGHILLLAQAALA
jgi:hypothetical protein